MAADIAIFFALIALYAAVAAKLGRWSITMPIVFVVLGALLGPRGLFSSHGAELLIELTLALLLFADAASLHFREVRDDARLPGRLLVIAMPLVVALGGLVAYGLFPGEGLGFALLLGAILAPTDAALGMPILSNPRVPVRIRRALSVESGLNDGIATPLVMLFTALAISQDVYFSGGWLRSALVELGIGAGAGIGIGLLGGWLFVTAVRRGWTASIGQQVGALALALCAFWAAKALGGNGFVAAFLGGLFFGHASHERLHVAVEFTETIGSTASLLVWAVFGANMVRSLFQPFEPLALLYAVLSLTVVRVIPVAVSLVRSGLRPDTTLIVGWFGPRGLASVVFGLMVYEAFHEAGRPIETLASVAGWTILLSVVLHGLSAVPVANLYARRLESAAADAPELMDVPELDIRRRGSLGRPQEAH